MLAAIAICPLAASTTCPLAVTVVAKRSLVAIVGAGGRVLDRHIEDAPEALEPDIIGGGYRTPSARTLPVLDPIRSGGTPSNDVREARSFDCRPERRRRGDRDHMPASRIRRANGINGPK